MQCESALQLTSQRLVTEYYFVEMVVRGEKKVFLNSAKTTPEKIGFEDSVEIVGSDEVKVLWKACEVIGSPIANI